MSTIKTKTELTISQHKLRRLEELEALATEYKAAKDEIIAMLDAGAKCQDGRLSALVSETATTSIAWKKEFEASHADEVAAISKRLKGKALRRSLVLNGRKV